MSSLLLIVSLFFFFNDTATTEIYTLSLHDALPIWWSLLLFSALSCLWHSRRCARQETDRKSTRLNSSHQIISYAVFCLKKKKIGRSHCPPGGSTFSNPWWKSRCQGAAPNPACWLSI